MNLQYQCSETLMLAKQGQLACSCRFFCRTLKRVPPLSKELSLDKINKTGFFIKIGQSVLKIGTFNLIMETDIHMASGVQKKVTYLIKTTEVGQ